MTANFKCNKGVHDVVMCIFMMDAHPTGRISHLCKKLQKSSKMKFFLALLTVCSFFVLAIEASPELGMLMYLSRQRQFMGMPGRGMGMGEISKMKFFLAALAICTLLIVAVEATPAWAMWYFLNSPNQQGMGKPNQPGGMGGKGANPWMNMFMLNELMN
ncbi:hypothetical protein ScPMuIL_016021 [Solemya velum]